MRRDPKNNWELTPTEEPTDDRRRQLSLKTLLIGMCILGAALGIGVNTARQIAIAMTPIKWRLLSAEDVDHLSNQKRYVIILKDINQAPLCGTAKEAYNNPNLRMDFHAWKCEPLYLVLPQDTDVYMRLKQRFQKVDGADEWLFIENGVSIGYSRAKRDWP